LEESSTPKVLERHAEVVDEWIRVSDREAFDAVKELAKEHKQLVGPSSGAVYAAAKETTHDPEKGEFVLLFGDDGREFMTLYNDVGVFEPGEFRRLVAMTDHLPSSPVFDVNAIRQTANRIQLN
jgi:threonine synthase